mmetsp:Transcript_16429/g.51378  ORF Transcript_16429/g.51378 Transcript_16429/m.51378 type:complete len:269 (+) Transcript_16429:294-1100(+)
MAGRLGPQAVTPPDVHAVEGCHVLVVQDEGTVERCQVLGKTLRRLGLWHRGNTALVVPAKDDLGGTAVVLLGDGQDSLVLEHLGARRRWASAKPRPVTGPEWRVRLEDDAVVLAQLHQVLLVQERVTLRLHDGNGNLAPRQVDELQQLRGVEVANAKVVDEPFGDKLFHFTPRVGPVGVLVDCVVAILDDGEHGPINGRGTLDRATGRVATSDTDILPGNAGTGLGPVDEESVNLGQAQILERRFEVTPHAARRQVCVPQLCLDLGEG